MKKATCILLALFVCAATLFATACSNNEQTEIEIEKTVVKVAAGDKKGTAYSFSKAAVEKMEELMETVDFKVKATDSIKDSIDRVAKKEMQMAMVQGDILDYAYHGKAYYKEDGAATNFSAVMGCYTQACQLVTSADAEIQSPSDLLEKTISVGSEGSSAAMNTEQILNAYGLNSSNVDLEYLSFADSAEAFKNGEIDAFFFTSGAPSTTVQEISIQKGIKLINISGDEIRPLIEKKPYYFEYTIPANTYTGQQEDIKTLGIKTVLIADNDLSEELIYNITKLLFEQKDAIAQINIKATEINKYSVTEGVTIPFHPGAEKFYKEVGAM